MIYRSIAPLAAILFCFSLAAGCSDGTDVANESSTGPTDRDPVLLENTPPATTEASHAHPTEGPHYGDLIELGDEEYHGELVHDGQAITIYILDRSATEAVPIESSEIKLNVVQDGTPTQFALQAQPQETDPEGSSSKFQIQDASLVSDLDAEGTTATLVLMIKGVSYRGNVSHTHSGHSHAGHDH